MNKRFQKLSCCTVFLCIFHGIILSSAPAAEPATVRTEKITIIGTGDLQGHLDAVPQILHITESGKKIKITGGISRIATLIRRIQQTTNNPVIVLSSGDDLMGPYFHQFHGKVIFGLMEESGYQILALGNHEFDNGPDVLAKALNSVDFPVLCSDLEVRGTSLEKSCQPYLIREYQGVRIGFFSLMTEDFSTITMTGKVKIRPDQDAAARDMVSLLKKKGAEVIIAVTHIGTSVDRTIAARVPGIDIIFGGHSHNYMGRPETVNNTLIVNGGKQGPALVRLDVCLDPKKHVVPASAIYSLIPVTEDITEDPTIKNHLAAYRKRLPAVEIIGRTRKPWFLNSEILRTRESGVADMITDMIRSQFNVDIVLYNSGAFRGDTEYPPGPITSRMLSAIDEFSSTVFLLSLQGKYLPEILEHSAALIGQGGFLQVSGIQFTIDTAGTAQKLARDSNENASYLIRRPGSRIKKILILSPNGSWSPLDPERTYQVATNDFLTHNGNRYFWFKHYGRNIRNSYFTMADVIRKYLKRNRVADPENPDGRILIR